MRHAAIFRMPPWSVTLSHSCRCPPRPLVLLLVLVAAALPQLSTTCLAGTMGIIVPAYFYPGTGGPGGVGDGWAAMAAAAAQVPLTAIFNPNSGPLPGPPDPNYVNAITNLETAGGQVVGFIYTNYGNTPVSTVESQISTYLTQYGHLIDGFFLDGASNNPSELSYYQTLDTFIAGLKSSYQVIINPGTATDQSYTQVATTIVTYDNQDSDYAAATPPSWVQNYPSSQFSNIIYDAPLSSLLGGAQLASQRNVGSVYITDQALNPPTGYLYSQLPSYWDQEVADIAAANAASVPEPGTLSMLGMGGLLTLAAVAASRRNAKQFVNLTNSVRPAAQTR